MGSLRTLKNLSKSRGEIIACDIYPSRLQLIESQSKRLGVTIVKTICTGEALKGSPTRRGFDKILVDAPRSGLGILRRYSDAKWKRTWSDIVELSEIQFRILLGTSYRLKVSGIIVYAVGTLMQEEKKT